MICETRIIYFPGYRLYCISTDNYKRAAEEKVFIVLKSTKIQRKNTKNRQQDNNYNGFDTGKTVVILRKRR